MKYCDECTDEIDSGGIAKGELLFCSAKCQSAYRDEGVKPGSHAWKLGYRGELKLGDLGKIMRGIPYAQGR